MDSLSNQIFYKDGRKMAIMLVEGSCVKYDNFRNFNMSLPTILRRRVERMPTDIDWKSIYILSPEKDLFSDDIDFEIIVYCDNLPQSDNFSIFCKKICTHFEKYITGYYTDLKLLLDDYPEAKETNDEIMKISDELCQKSLSFSAQSFSAQSLSPPSDPFPSQIQENLFLGDVYFSSNKNFLCEKNITAIVSVMQEANLLSNDSEYAHFRFHHIPILDKCGVNILEHINDCIEFIRKCHHDKINVYVHCAMGISRSVSFVIAYLMQTRKITFNEAYKIVKDKRPQSEPNFSFACQLTEFEKQLFN